MLLAVGCGATTAAIPEYPPLPAGEAVVSTTAPAPAPAPAPPAQPAPALEADSVGEPPQEGADEAWPSSSRLSPSDVVRFGSVKVSDLIWYRLLRYSTLTPGHVRRRGA